MTKSIVRVLFGDPFGNIYWSYRRNHHKQNPLGSDLIDKRSEYELNDIDYFVMGEKNKELLVNLGCKKIHYFEEIVIPEDMTPFYNKVYLINEAMKMFDEILYLDFDIVTQKTPDDEMWEILRTPHGKLQGRFKAPPIKR